MRLFNPNEKTSSSEDSNIQETTIIPSLYFNYDEVQLNDICKHQIDSFEHWSRRLIDETFKKIYGNDYFNLKDENGNAIFKKDLLDKINGRMSSDPKRFARMIDAIVIEDLWYIFCKQEWYSRFFKGIFEEFFSGVDEVRSVIRRIANIRNKISHGNAISLHEAEQCICYTNDFIGVLKKYYIKIGKEKIYNVPVFLSFKDIFGNCFVRENMECDWSVRISSISNVFSLRSGDSYKLWLEVDNSYDLSLYDVKWKIETYKRIVKEGEGTTIEFKATDELVSRRVHITVKLITKKTWHRFANSDCDDEINIYLDAILPPIEDTY